jgi:glycosyltransferase involved in cell wall biosynthesis
VLEAMATGRAVITTDAPGCRETVVEGETGLLVPPRDSGALYAAMRRFVEQPQLIAPMGDSARRLAEEKYDVERVSARILEHAGL